MKLIFIVIILLSPLTVLGQEYVIKDFSNRYYAIIKIDKDQQEDFFKKGTISIFQTAGNKELLKVSSEKIIIESNKDIFNQKVVELPFKDQDVVLYQDFNFDGVDDIAILELYSSKGPGYAIYLFKEQKFILDAEYTDIIQGSQGNFELVPESKTIATMSSGGCCWHSFSNYSIINGRPYPIEQVIEEIDLPFTTIRTKRWKDGLSTESVKRTVDLEQEGIVEIMSFKLLNKNKRVVLYNLNDRILNYVLIENEDIPEFSFPIEVVYKGRDFVVNNSGNELTFKNKDAQYKIYQMVNDGRITDLGLIVTFKGKRYIMKGELKTLKGSISKKEILKLDNVYNE
jgi:hypothetical protein